MKVNLPKYDEPLCSVTLNKSQIKILIDALDVSIERMLNTKSAFMAIDDAAIGTFGPVIGGGYSIISSLTIENANDVTLKDFLYARNALIRYYKKPHLVKVRLLEPNWYYPEYVIGSEKLVLWGGRSSIDHLVHDIIEYGEIKL